MGALYYCTDGDVTDQLPDSLTDSPIDTSAKRDIKLRAAARDWIDSLYPRVAPFPNVNALSVEWLVNQADHAAGDTTVTIDGGTGDPVTDDLFRIALHNTWYKVSAYSSNVITFASGPPDWAGSALAAFPDNARVLIGTPGLIRAAATHFATGIGILILRRNPEDKMAQAAFALAKMTLGISKDGVATREPWPYSPDAVDAGLSPPVYTTGEATLTR